MRVLNAYGDIVWEDENVDRVTGAEHVEEEYPEPTEEGMYYQFRVVSWSEATGGQEASPISRTQDLKGVFYFE